MLSAEIFTQSAKYYSVNTTLTLGPDKEWIQTFFFWFLYYYFFTRAYQDIK